MKKTQKKKQEINKRSNKFLQRSSKNYLKEKEVEKGRVQRKTEKQEEIKEEELDQEELE